MKPRLIRSLQAKDAKINNIRQRLQVGYLDANVYMVEDSILRKRIVEYTGKEFKPIVLPKYMVDHVLLTVHDYSGHNGFPRMYAATRCLYFWVGMKKDVQRHCKKCQLCTKHNILRSSLRKPILKELTSPCNS